MRLLFVYGFEPSGHSSAARALEERARALGHETTRLNVSAHHPLAGPAIARLYLAVIQRFPKLWRFLYDNETLPRIAQNWRRVYLMLNGDRLRGMLERLHPDVIVCTHAPPMGALALEKDRGRLPCPLVGVVTDMRIHSYWVRPGADLYLVPSPAAADQLFASGVARSRVRDSGIPIHPTFAEPLERGAARARLGLAGPGPVLLLSGGSRGLGHIGAMAGALLEKVPQARVLVATGSNTGLFRYLRARYRQERRIWVYPTLAPERVKELMCASDLFVGKAGGLTISECLASSLPMVLFEPLPGQESHNVNYLVGGGAAVAARGLCELGDLTVQSLAPERLSKLSAAAFALARPRSAEDGIAAILAVTKESHGAHR